MRPPKAYRKKHACAEKVKNFHNATTLEIFHNFRMIKSEIYAIFDMIGTFIYDFAVYRRLTA